MAMFSVIWVILAFFLQSECEGTFPKLQRKMADISSGVQTCFHTVWATMSTLNIETIQEVVIVNSFPLVTYALLLCILVRISRENRINKILEKEISGIKNSKNHGLADVAALCGKFAPMISGLQKQVFLLEKEKKSLSQNMAFSQEEMSELRTYISGMPVFDHTSIDELRHQVNLLEKENKSLAEKLEDIRKELVMSTKEAATPESETEKLDEMRQEYHDLFYNHREYYTTSLSCLERDFWNFVHWTNHKIGWLSYNTDYMTHQLNNMDKYCPSAASSCMSTQTTGHNKQN